MFHLNKNLKPTAANAQHRGRRENQEDSFGFSQFSNSEFVAHGGYVSVVADGMGGLENGTLASTTALRVFLSAYQQKSPDESVLDALKRAAVEANGEVYRTAVSLSAMDRMGSTLVAASVIGNRLEWIGIGDSRLYHSSGGVFRQLSEDHNFGQVLDAQVAQGIISEEEAVAHPKAQALTSYLGREQIPFMSSSESGAIKLRSGDWIVLCSDGLSGSLSAEEIAKELYGNPKEASDRLLLRALSKDFPHQDNITLLVLCMDEQGEVSGITVKNDRRKVALFSSGAIGIGAAAALVLLLLPGVKTPIQPDLSLQSASGTPQVATQTAEPPPPPSCTENCEGAVIDKPNPNPPVDKPKKVKSPTLVKPKTVVGTTIVKPSVSSEHKGETKKPDGGADLKITKIVSVPKVPGPSVVSEVPTLHKASEVVASPVIYPESGTPTGDK